MTASTTTPPTYFRKGFGLKAEVEEELAVAYDGRLVDLLKERDYSLSAGGVTVRLAREFGFCYGVERAVEYAYQTRKKFPDKKIYLAGEIIHNPHINRRLADAGVIFLKHNANTTEASFDFSIVDPDDVVMLPAFGVTVADFVTLRERGCVMVDTTCGSVLNVWKRVEGYARDGFTALIHGKYYHEETRATASQVMKHPGGQYLIVRDMDEVRIVCDFLEGKRSAAEISEKFAPHAASPEFDPDRDLKRIGVANQTTMLASESLAIAAETRAAMARGKGEEYAAANFRTFDTICSATQDRQDAVKELLLDPPDIMLVVGGYNSSNTISLTALCADKVQTYHIEDAACLDVENDVIHHRVRQGHDDVTTPRWLPSEGEVVVGITAGASTPNNKIAETVARVFATRGVDPATIV